MNISNPILKVDSIRKDFNNISAVKNLSFEISRGEIFALLGPNGAGKTTTVRMLMNIIKPDYGKITFNFDSKKHSDSFPSDLFGYLPEERGLYLEIPILKTLVFMGIIRGLEKKQALNFANEWLEKLQLSDRKSEKLSSLSKGNQQKVQFISSIIHNPAFAILDEPFSGFDPINQELFLDIIKELSSKGTTILLSAHQMQLVERIADRVLLLNKGKEIISGTVDYIKKSYSADEIIIIKIAGKPDLSVIDNEEAVDKAELCGQNEIKIYLKREKDLSGLLRNISHIYKIISIRSEHISLHDIFIDKIKNDFSN